MSLLQRSFFEKVCCVCAFVFLICSDILKRHLAKCRAATGSEHILIEPETPNAPPRRACDRCARLKVRCDFVQPCSRCSRQSMDCTYHRLNSNRANGSSDERRSSQVGINGNGNGTHPHIKQAVDDSSMKGLGLTQTPEPFPGFRGSFSLTQTQAVPTLTSPSIGVYNLQQSSPQDHLNHISPPNQPAHHDRNNSTSGLSPFNSFPNLPTPNPTMMDLTQPTTQHQPVFSQNLDLANSNDADVMFASSDPSDMIFNTQFSAEDTFYTWKPFEYNVNNDASLEFLFGPDLGFFDIGFSPNDLPITESYIPPSLNAPEPSTEKGEKEEVPDEGLVATFDPGTGDGAPEESVVPQAPSRGGLRSYEAGDSLQLMQIDPLQARVDALTIAVFGNLENLQHQDTWTQEFFKTENVKAMLFLWSKRWAQHVPIIHLPTFSILTCPDALLFILCVIGKAYARPGVDPDRLQWCVDVFSKLSSMARVNGELDMLNLEAVYILVVLCTWHGNKQQRDMARRLYREVVDMARKYGYCQVLPKKKTNGTDEAEWQAWIERETRIRYPKSRNTLLN